jgi:hypothetical protein
MERRGRIEDLDRSFDLEFWQAQTPSARAQAAWELVVHASRVKDIDVRQLRLQRSVEAFGRQHESLKHASVHFSQLTRSERELE